MWSWACRGWVVLAILSAVLTGCDGGETDPPDEPEWALVMSDQPGALLSIWGTSASDVWVVGADALDGTGPLVLRYDGAAWERLETGETQGDLWWVHGFEGGPVFLGGSDGVILRWESGAFTKMTTPGTGTVFGLWGASAGAMWAVGGSADKAGFAWRLAGDAWEPEASLPADVVADAAIWKMYGHAADDAWMVGSNGVSFHWDGAALEQGDTGVGSSLFTVHANAERYTAVGGLVSGFIVEDDGSGWKDALPGGALYGLTGVHLGEGDVGWAVGQYGSVYSRDASGWHEEDHGLHFKGDLHAVWLDPSGGVWAAGGQTSSFPLTEGLLVHRGDPVAEGGP